MGDEINLRKLATSVRNKRRTRPLREVAAEIGAVSAATLSRVEQGNMPDLQTFIRLCRWLDMPPESFADIAGRNARDLPTPALIAAQLHADPQLSTEAADALSVTIQLAYDAARRGEQ